MAKARSNSPVTSPTAWE